MFTYRFWESNLGASTSHCLTRKTVRCISGQRWTVIMASKLNACRLVKVMHQSALSYLRQDERGWSSVLEHHLTKSSSLRRLSIYNKHISLLFICSIFFLIETHCTCQLVKISKATYFQVFRSYLLLRSPPKHLWFLGYDIKWGFIVFLFHRQKLPT